MMNDLNFDFILRKKLKRKYIRKNMELYNKNINLIKNENLETRLTKPISNFQKNVTLYHGTTYRIPNSIIDPAQGRINTGTKLSHARYSTWWTRDPYFPFFYSTYGTLFNYCIKSGLIPNNKTNTKNMGELTHRLMILDHKTKTLYLNEKYKKDFINEINKHPGFVYTTNVPWNIVGRGHDVTLNEFTLDIPVKCDEIIVDFKELSKYINIKFVSEQYLEFIYPNFHENRDIYNPNIMEKIIYRTIDERIRRGKEIKPLTRRYYENN